MRGRLGLLATVLTLSFGTAASAMASAPRIAFVSFTKSVTAGGTISAVVRVNGSARTCLVTLSIGGTATQKTARVQRGRVSLVWSTSSSIPAGQAAITVACPGSGSATAHVVITTPVVRATVSVGKSGFTTNQTSGSTGLINYGAVLTNPSPDEDALNVQLTANFLDAGGHIVSTDVFHLQDIPAASTFYYGGLATLSAANAAPVTMQLTTLIGDVQRASHVPMPVASNVRLTADPYEGEHVQGQFSNPTGKTLSTLTSITYVVFDAAGNVLSGGITFSVGNVPPGGSIGFDDWDFSLDPSRAASVQASINSWFSS